MKKKTLIVSLCVILVLALTVGGTLAYLRDSAEDVANFSGGDYVKIADLSTPEAIDEKVIPGKTVEYDPSVTIDNTVDAWLFVEFVDDAGLLDGTPMASGWTNLEGNVYYREVAADAAEKTFSIFEGGEVVFSVDLENDDVENFSDESISIRAYAIQKDYIADVDAAWAAAQP